MVSRALSFLFELVFGFLTKLILILVWILGKGLTLILTTNYSLEDLFGFDYMKLWPGLTIVCAFIMIMLILLDVVKGLSEIEDVQRKSAGDYLKRILGAYILLTILPTVIKVWQAISAGLSKYISAVMTAILGKNIGLDSGFQFMSDTAQNAYDSSGNAFSGATPQEAKFLISLIFLIIVIIGFSLIGISLMKRYVELLIATLFIPYIATSVYKDFDKLNSWLAKVAQIFVGYLLNILLLYVMIGMSSKLLDPALTIEQSIVLLFLMIAVILVAVNGSNAIKDYVYSGGTGSQAYSFINAAGRQMIRSGRMK